MVDTNQLKRLRPRLSLRCDCFSSRSYNVLSSLSNGDTDPLSQQRLSNWCLPELSSQNTERLPGHPAHISGFTSAVTVASYCCGALFHHCTELIEACVESSFIINVLASRLKSFRLLRCCEMHEIATSPHWNSIKANCQSKISRLIV